MKLDYDIYEFLRRQLPNHKRQTNRLALFFWALNQLKTVWTGFTAWRDDMIYESNITGQKLSLVDFLNNRVSGSNNGISITEVTEAGIYLGMESEALDSAYFSLLSENTDIQEIAMYGEGGTALSVDFQVKVPAGVNHDEVSEIVERYVIAGFNYEVINV